MNYNLDVIYQDCQVLFNKIECSKLKNKNVLITGANGLIGSFIADFLCFLNTTQDFNIKIYLTSYSHVEKAERIKHLVNREDVKYFSWDCSENIDPYLLTPDIDYIFFCSGYGQPSKFTKDNVKTSFINTIGVNSLLNYLTNLNKKTNFLFISTSEVYGNPDEFNIPTEEKYNGNYSLSNSRASYIVSKRLGEVICNDYAKNFENINIKIARVGLMYGPGVLLTDQRVLQDFIFKAKNNNIIELLDSGGSLRNYLYLVDGVEILLNLILNSNSNETTYNVGGDQEPVTILQLAEKIAIIMGVKVKVNNDNLNNEIVNNSPKNVYLSMKKYRNEFNKQKNNFTSLDIGIYNVIKWYNFIK